MASNQIANMLHAGGLILIRREDQGGSKIIAGTGWGLKSLRYQPGNLPNSQPPVWLISLEEPIYGVRPYPNDETAPGWGFVSATPQNGSYDGNNWLPFIPWAGLIPEDGPEPGGVRLALQRSDVIESFFDNTIQGAVLISLLVWRCPSL